MSYSVTKKASYTLGFIGIACLSLQACSSDPVATQTVEEACTILQDELQSSLAATQKASEEALAAGEITNMGEPLEALGAAVNDVAVKITNTEIRDSLDSIVEGYNEVATFMSELDHGSVDLSNPNAFAEIQALNSEAFTEENLNTDSLNENMNKVVETCGLV